MDFLKTKQLNFLLLLLFLSGCSRYHSQSLPTESSFIKNPTEITTKNYTLLFPRVKAHQYDPRKGFDMTDIAILAVINNPALTLARDDVHITKAQSFSAGLLPDPQVNFERVYPLNPGDIKGFNSGLTEDFQSILDYPLQKKIGKTSLSQAELNLLWQEWQVISQAKILFTQIISEEQQLNVLNKNNAIMNLAYERIQEELRNGNETIDNVSVQLTAIQTVMQQTNTLTQQLNQNEHALNQLLNLSPETHLALNPAYYLELWNEKEIKEALPDLIQRRPDVMALREGYNSQDAKYRQAIINQFPIITLGFSRSTDTTNASYYGFGFTMNLPLFNRNRGNIAIEKATRQKLYDTYQQAINTSYSDVYTIIDNQKILQEQYQQLQKRSFSLRKLMDSSQRAYQQGDITIINYSDIISNNINAQLGLISTAQLITEQKIALQTLLGPLEDVDIGDKKGKCHEEK